MYDVDVPGSNEPNIVKPQLFIIFGHQLFDCFGHMNYINHQKSKESLSVI